MRLALQSCANRGGVPGAARQDGRRPRRDGQLRASSTPKGARRSSRTGRKAHKRFDATDPKVAPNGFIVRTNYSDSGDTRTGPASSGGEQATSLLDELVKAKALAAPTLPPVPARDVANVRIGSYPAKGLPAGAHWAYTADSRLQVRHRLRRAVRGRAPGEDPLLATLWVIVGQPITGAAVPVWVRAARVPSALAPALKASEMTQALDAVRTVFYPRPAAS